MERRRRLLDRGRVGASRHVQPSPFPPPPPPGGKSQGPAHGQGLGLGLYLLTMGGSSPGQQKKTATTIAPTLRASTKTAAAAGQPGVNPQSYTITLPTYVAGDLGVIHLLWKSGILGSPSTPTGWTLQGSQQSGSGTPLVTYVYTRLMTGTEGTTVTVTEGTPFVSTFSAAASSWRNVNGQTPVLAAVGNSSGSVTSTTWTAAGLVSTGTQPCAIVAVLTEQGSDDIVPTNPAATGYDYLDTSQVVTNANFRFADAAYVATSAGTYSISGGFTAGASDYWGVIGLVLKGG